MAVVVMLGQLIHHIQRERDMSVLYLSDLGPGTKTFLLAEYMATDDALQELTIWPGGLQVSWTPNCLVSYRYKECILY